jgi:hypothetical protein
MSSNKYKTKTKVTLLAKQLLDSVNDPTPVSDPIDSDSDSDDEDDFPHLYANIPPPPQTLTSSLATRQSLTNPNPINIETKIQELALISALINALINDLGDRLITYQNLTDDIFCSYSWNANPEPQQMSSQNTCLWKLHLMSDLIKNILPPPTQLIPDLRVTDPEGCVYTLEEVIPEMDEEYYAKLVEKREYHHWEMENWLFESDEIDAEWHEARKGHFKQWQEEDDETSDDDSTETTLSDFDISDEDTPSGFTLNETSDEVSDHNTSIYFTSNDTSDEISDNNTSIYFTSDEMPINYTSDNNILLDTTQNDTSDEKSLNNTSDDSRSEATTILRHLPAVGSLDKIRILTTLMTKTDTFLHTMFMEAHIRDRAARLEEEARDAAWEKEQREAERWKIGKRVGGLLRKFRDDRKDRGEKEWEMEWEEGRRLIADMRRRMRFMGFGELDKL